jgi:hypothetical protein
VNSSFLIYLDSCVIFLLQIPKSYSSKIEKYFVSMYCTVRNVYVPGSECCPDWIACRVLSIDYEFPPADFTVYTGEMKEEVARGLIMVLQLGPIHLSQSPKDKEKEEEKEKEKETTKSNKSTATFSLKRTFFVLYRPGHQCPEFLIRRQQMRECFAMCWHLKAPHKIDPVPTPGTAPVPTPVPVIGSQNSHVIECTRRFSCTYDSGEVWCGTVLRVVRDPYGIPLWSGKFARHRHVLLSILSLINITNFLSFS